MEVMGKKTPQKAKSNAPVTTNVLTWIYQVQDEKKEEIYYSS